MSAASCKHHNSERMIIPLGIIGIMLISAIMVIVPIEESEAEVESYNYMTMNATSSDDLHFTIYAQTDSGWEVAGYVDLRWEHDSRNSLFPWSYNLTREYGAIEWWMSTDQNELIHFNNLFMSVGSWTKYGMGTGTTASSLHQNFDFRLANANSVCILENPEECIDFWVEYTIGTTVSFDMNGGSGSMSSLSTSDTSSDFSLTDTERFTLPSDVPVWEGHRFLGWSTSESGDAVYQPGQSITINKGFDVTLYAVWEEDSATVTFVSNGSTYQTVSVPIGQTVTMPDDPELYGYTFKGWYIDNTFVTEFDPATTITQNITLYAKWEGNLEFTTDPIADGTVTPVSGSPGTVLFSASASKDYTSLVWDFGDGSTSTNTYVTHYYSEPGTYTATLTVYNGYGEDTTTFTIEVPGDDSGDGVPWTIVIAAVLAVVIIGALIARYLL